MAVSDSTSATTIRARLLNANFVRALVVTFCYFMCIGMLQPELPRYIVGPLAGNGLAIGAAMTTFLFTACALRSVAGSVTMKYGNKRIIIVGCAIVALSILGYGQGGLPGLLAARAITGAGEALVYVGISALILDLAPANRAAEATSYFTVGLFGGLAVGPIVGEFLRQHLSYASVWIFAASCAAAAALATCTVHEAHSVPVRAKTVKLAAPRWRGSMRRVVQPDAIGPAILFAVSMIGYAGFNAFVPLYVGRVGMTSAGPVFALAAVVIIVLRLIGARIPTALGALRCSLASFALQGSGWLIVAEWTTRTGLFVGTGIAAVGVSLLYPALFTAAVNRAPRSERGFAIGTFTMLSDLAVGLGAVVLGGVVTFSGGNEQHAFEAACLVNVVCFVLLAVRRDLVASTRTG
jgi:MFS family permease